MMFYCHCSSVLCSFWQAAARYRTPYPTDVKQEVLKQLPHMIAGVNLFHFYFCVHVAMIQEVDVGDFDLKGEEKKRGKTNPQSQKQT